MTTTTLKIQYDKPFEVTEKQFNALRDKCSGMLCHRIDDNGKYWIKVWLMNEVGYIKEILNKYK